MESIGGITNFRNKLSRVDRKMYAAFCFLVHYNVKYYFLLKRPLFRSFIVFLTEITVNED